MRLKTNKQRDWFKALPKEEQDKLRAAREKKGQQKRNKINKDIKSHKIGIVALADYYGGDSYALNYDS